uniref:Uncharacterized protein n=1 Tax=uncultured bacterium Contig17 TaxID=1393492 RepID=W0FLI1_9BACT|nr:hypothetical protein [uncultured bacterium Contig17]
MFCSIRHHIFIPMHIAASYHEENWKAYGASGHQSSLSALLPVSRPVEIPGKSSWGQRIEGLYHRTAADIPSFIQHDSLEGLRLYPSRFFFPDPEAF